MHSITAEWHSPMHCLLLYIPWLIRQVAFSTGHLPYGCANANLSSICNQVQSKDPVAAERCALRLQENGTGRNMPAGPDQQPLRED